jgi:transcriptional antiterminator RfaH
MKEQTPVFRWLVLYVRPRFEKKVHVRLQEKGVTSFLPERRELRIWSDRKKFIMAPLFPGYLFVHVDEKHRVAALETDGALTYVRFGGKVAVVRNDVIRSLQIAVESREQLELEKPQLKLGQKIRIRSGPLAGLTGHLTGFRGNTRVAIRVDAIDQIVSLQVALSELEIIEA